jgi:hypothetical protein
MNASSASSHVVQLDTTVPVWEQFFTVAPLVLVGTRDEGGSLDLAPKHMVTPMGWENYFGFVCTPRHKTCSNVERTGEFTVSYPKPSQVLMSSLAASPRGAEGGKPVIDYLMVICTSNVVTTKRSAALARIALSLARSLPPTPTSATCGPQRQMTRRRSMRHHCSPTSRLADSRR